MREILFRGKRTDNGEWVEGFYAKHFAPNFKHYVIYYSDKSHGMNNMYHFVDPETIGQYTGLTDKNGKRIFEGDIVDMHRKGCGFKPVECVEYEEGGFSPIAVAGWECTPEHNEIEVIGNIYDNPELLK